MDTIIGQFCDTEITLNEVKKNLQLRNDLQALLQRAYRRRLVLSEAKAAGIAANDEELQAQADQVRLAMGLASADKTVQWLESNKLSIDDLEAEAEYLVLKEKLFTQLLSEKVEPTFHESKTGFDEVELAHLVVAEEGVARELMTQIEEDEEDFGELVKEHSVDQKTASRNGYLGSVRRGALSPEAESAAFGAASGDVLGPFEVKKHWVLYQVLGQKPASLTPEIKQEIFTALVERWFREKERAVASAT